MYGIFGHCVFLSSYKLSISALLNGFVSEIEKKGIIDSYQEILAFGKELFITTEPITPIKEDETELLVLTGITNE